MANITIEIKLREHIEDETFTLATNDTSKVNNISIKPTGQGEFDERSGNLQGLQALSFAKGFLRFDNDGILKNFDSQNGYLQSENEPLEYIFGATDDNGYYEVELSITGTDVQGLSSIVIYGDKLANQFPTEATIDGIPFFSDDYKLVIPLDTSKLSHTIIFTKWNRPNYNACLTVIRATMEYLTYTNTEIDSLKSLERTSTNGSEINYGTIANSSLIELIDEDEEIKDLVNDGVLPVSNVPIEIKFNGRILQHHISNDTNYDITQGMFSLSLSNKVEMLDKLKYQGFAYPEHSLSLYQILYMVIDSLNKGVGYTEYTYFLRKMLDEYNVIDFNENHYTDEEMYRIISPNLTTDISFNDFYRLILGNNPPDSATKDEKISTLYHALTQNTIPDDYKKQYNIIFNDILTNKCMTPDGEMYIYEYLKKIELEYPVIEYGYTYRQVLDDICKIAQLNMFVNKENQYEFISARPLLLNGEIENALRITRDTLKEPPNYDLIVKNKYEAVDISENSVSDLIDYDTVVYPANIQFNNIQDTDFTLYTKTNQHIEERSQFISSATFYYEIVSFILSNYYTYQGTITIPKKTLNNLTQITFINESIFRSNNFAYSIKYNKYIGNVTADSVWDRRDNKITVSNITYSSESLYGQVSENGIMEDISNYTYTLPDSTQTTATTSTYPNNPLITLLSDNENFYVTYTITAQKKLTKLGGAGRWTAASTSSIDVPLTGEFENYIPLELEFSIYGNKRVISFDNTSVSSPNVNTAEVVANFGNTTTKLLQDKCTYNGTKISSVIKDNILDDYQYGISNLRLQMFTTDLKDKDGNIKKVLKNGQVLNIGDVGFLTNDKDKINQQRYWSVYNTEYTYDGSVDESVQLNQKREYYGLYNDKYFIGWNHLINNNELLITKDLSNRNHLSTYDNNKNLNGKLIVNSNVDIIGLYENNEFKGFINCINLKEIVLPTTLKSFMDYSFSGCSNLTNINIPDNITSLSVNMFQNCISLTKFNIPNTITYIAGGTFGGCTGLKTIFIPSSVRSLGSPSVTYATKVFFECSPNLIIYCEANSKPENWESNWNVYNENNDTLQVKWGYTREQYEQEISNNT